MMMGMSTLDMVASKIVEAKTDFSGGKYMYFDYKRGEIHLMVWLASG
jgi:hypothetical protein